ncbi:MAG: permease [Bacillota bacterium]|jgi:uncharacterized membrane protein YraQ (UPF0718 family)|nr:permease [Bacillota bacterium]MDD3851695.1 permease [Bacillota bacterium]MDD4708332.1 permease [Bacillota bacterium]
MKKLKPYMLLILVVIADLIVFAGSPDLGKVILKSTGTNFAQMLGVIPPIFLLIGLMDVWVPREKVIKFMGEGSGITGVLLAILLGAAAAGPLYAAFPVAAIMIKKGAKFTNILVFLGAWSTMKIPMFLFEMASLGYAFAITRLLLSLTGILLMSWLINKLMSEDEKRNIYAKHSDVARG